MMLGSARASASIPRSAIMEMTGIRILRVERFDCVCDGVDPGSRGETWGKRERQIDVVDDNLREHFHAALRRLAAFLRFAEDGSGFRAGIGGWHDDLREVRAQSDGFAQAGR